MSIADLVIILPTTLINFADIIYDILFTSITTPLGDVSIFALIFGVGLSVIVGVRVARLFLP
jgi:hypothetical protein